MKLTAIFAANALLALTTIFLSQPSNVAPLGSGTVDFDGLMLVVTGTDLNDTLVMDRSFNTGGFNLRLNGAQYRIDNYPDLIQIYMGDGDDRVINDFEGTDIIFSVYGQGGNDMLHDKRGNTYLSGGSDDDVLISSSTSPRFYAEINGGTGDDEIYAGPGSLFLVSGGAGDDMIFGGGGSDDLNGGPGDDIIYGGSGGDTLVGNSGEDMLFGGSGNDFIYAGYSSIDTVGDVVYGGSGHDVIDGSPFDDQIFAGPGRDDVRGHGGNDTIIGGAGNDYLYGGDGDDYISCGAGDDVADGEGGTDGVYGNTGDDTLTGSGADIVRQ